MKNGNLAKALTALEPKIKVERVREVMPVIEERIAAGVRIADIARALQDGGIDLNEATLRSYLYQHRKKRRESDRQ